MPGETQRNTISVRCKLYNVNAVANVVIVNSVPGPGIKFLRFGKRSVAL